MIVVATQEFKMSAVVLPEDYEQEAARPEVDELEESIGAHGVLQPVGIEHGTNQLVWGRKRFAASARLGLSHVPSLVVKFDDRFEKAIVVMRENLDRADLSPDQRALQRARIAELEEERIREREELADASWPANELTFEPDPDAPPPGAEPGTLVSRSPGLLKRPGAPSKGRLEAAKKLGISQRQLSKDIKRAKELKAGIAAGPVTVSSLPVPDHGLDLDEATHAEIVGACSDFDDMTKALRKAHKLAKGRAGLLSKDLVESIECNAQEVAAAAPGMVCPYCACRTRLRTNCGECGGRGWIGTDEVTAVPPELLDLSEGKRVYVGRKLVKASTL